MNIWSLVGWTFREVLGGVVLLEEVWPYWRGCVSRARL